MLGVVSQTALIGIVYLGAFSRFTHGRYTRSFYQYQLDRAPNNDYTRFIPFVDATLGTLVLISRTRTLAALFCAMLQGGGIVKRSKEGKPIAQDAVLLSIALMAFLTSWYGTK
jgi:hypothetical protein